MASALWIKQQVRRRDRFRCTECGMTNADHQRLYHKQLHVHRLVPGSPYAEDGCATLCFKCHGKKPGQSRPLGARPGSRLINVTACLTREEVDYLQSVASELEATVPGSKPWTPGRALSWLVRNRLIGASGQEELHA